MLRQAEIRMDSLPEYHHLPPSEKLVAALPGWYEWNCSFFHLLCQLRSLLRFQCKSDFILHNMYPPFFFGSTYITLMAQNSKTFLIIFLQKNTHKNCAFSIVLHMVFMRILVLSGKTKSAKEAVFYGNFHIIWILWVSPLFNSAKIRTKGAIGLQAERL